MRVLKIFLVSTPIALLLNGLMYVLILAISVNMNEISEENIGFAVGNTMKLVLLLIGGFPLFLNAVISTSIWNAKHKIQGYKEAYAINKFTISYSYGFVLFHALINYTNGDTEIFRANLFSLTFLPIVWFVGGDFRKDENTSKD